MSRTKDSANFTGIRPLLSARIPQPTMARLDAICAERGVSRAEAAREAVALFVERQERRQRRRDEHDSGDR